MNCDATKTVTKKELLKKIYNMYVCTNIKKIIIINFDL